jgi:hypothetical protein
MPKHTPQEIFTLDTSNGTPRVQLRLAPELLTLSYDEQRREMAKAGTRLKIEWLTELWRGGFLPRDVWQWQAQGIVAGYAYTVTVAALMPSEGKWIASDFEAHKAEVCAPLLRWIARQQTPPTQQAARRSLSAILSHDSRLVFKAERY